MVDGGGEGLKVREGVRRESYLQIFIFILFFFFFKQKTAYEIVDCDWSSDVCSSDLCARSSPFRDGW